MSSERFIMIDNKDILHQELAYTLMMMDRSNERVTLKESARTECRLIMPPLDFSYQESNMSADPVPHKERYSSMLEEFIRERLRELKTDPIKLKSSKNKSKRERKK